MIAGVAAVVGRPNVGKSTLFNRIIGSRMAIVEETPGVTRDRLYGRGEWLTKEFRVIDTGGIQLADQPFQKEIQAQVDIAVEEADTVIFVVDGKAGVTDDDLFIARRLQKSGKPVLLAVNKIDDVSRIPNVYEFYKLGCGDPIAVSAVQGIGVGDLLDALVKSFEGVVHEEYEGKICFSVIGQPNVGKSSLVNAILQEDRSIVSPVAGTTRDAVDTPFTRGGKEYVVIDTAGIRQRGRVYEKIEKYSILRAERAVDRSDVVLVVLDGEAGIREQDKHVAGIAHDAGKGVILVYNKWDTVEKDEKTMGKLEKEVRAQFAYLDYAPLVFVSAKTGEKVSRLFPLIAEVYEEGRKTIKPSVVNQVLEEAASVAPPPSHKGKRLRVKYAVQVGTAPPTFVVFVNNTELFHFSYERYLANQFRRAFGFMGNPIRILARVK